MQERCFAARQDAVGDDAHQPCRIATAAERRIGAHAADLGKARHAHTLTRHGDQPPIVFDPDELAEAVGVSGKGAGLRRPRQGKHLHGIVLA